MAYWLPEVSSVIPVRSRAAALVLLLYGALDLGQVAAGQGRHTLGQKLEPTQELYPLASDD